MTPRATIDFETRSACSIRACGSWRYSLDPTTELLCLAFRLPAWEPGRTALWHPSFRHLDIEEDGLYDLVELFDWVESGGLVESHNSWFEAGIWANICVPRYGWPVLPTRQRRCSAAKAAAHSLPRGLSDAADALNLALRKDDEGAAIMKKMVKPRKANKSDWQVHGRLYAPCVWCEGTGRVASLKKDGTPTKKGAKCDRCLGSGVEPGAALPPMPILYHESRELFERLWAYCRVDVLAEEALSEALPDLSPDEQEMYLLDQAINERGFRLDEDAIAAALDLVDDEFADLNAELAVLTGGEVEKATQRAKMTVWLAKQGLELDDTTADTLDEALERTDLTEPARRGVEIMRTLGKSSTAKFEAMRNWLCPDKRVHGGLLYHGANTGRWTGAGVQPHNFPRGDVKDPVTHEAPDPELLWAFLSTRDRELITSEFGSVMGALSAGLRGVITASPDKQLYVADFNAIECRVLFWHADDEVGLDIFRAGKDPYNEMATTIFGYPVNRKLSEHKEQGALGKVAILGLGYQMGAAKFADTAETMGGIKIPVDILCTKCGENERAHLRYNAECDEWTPDLPEDTMTSFKVVDAYRTKFERVKWLWQNQNDAAIRAVKFGRRVECGKVAWYLAEDIDFLYCELPSGRRLAYPNPKVRRVLTSWGKEVDELTYAGVNPFNRQWSRQKAYGGLLVENIVQATARDLMADAMVRAEAAGYETVLTVHDELVAEVPLGFGDVHEFEQLMAELPPWAEGCPVAAEGWRGTRYRK